LEKTCFAQIVPIFSEPFDEEFDMPITPIDEEPASPVYVPSMLNLLFGQQEYSPEHVPHNGRPLAKGNALRRNVRSLSPPPSEKMTDGVVHLQVLPSSSATEGSNPSPYKFLHRQTTCIALSGKEMVLQTFMHRLSA
jgi:hypothetical protein